MLVEIERGTAVHFIFVEARRLLSLFLFVDILLSVCLLFSFFITKGYCFGLDCSFPKLNSYVEALTPNVSIFGERPYQEVVTETGAIRRSRAG